MIEKIISIEIYNIHVLFVVGSKGELEQSLKKHLEKKKMQKMLILLW